MTLTILDPRTGKRVTLEVAAKPKLARARREVLQRLDRLGTAQPSLTVTPRT
jgi:hypothetical protein